MSPNSFIPSKGEQVFRPEWPRQHLEKIYNPLQSIKRMGAEAMKSATMVTLVSLLLSASGCSRKLNVAADVQAIKYINLPFRQR